MLRNTLFALFAATISLPTVASSYIYLLEKDRSRIYIFGGAHYHVDSSALLSECVNNTAKTANKIYLETDPYIANVKAAKKTATVRANEVVESLSTKALTIVRSAYGRHYDHRIKENAASLYNLSSMLNPILAGYLASQSQELGFDYQLYTLAKRNHIEVGEIEPIDVQLNAIGSVPADAWAKAINFNLEIIGDETQSNDLLSTIKADANAAILGDEEWLTEKSLYTKEPYVDLFKRIIFQRNPFMASRIFELASESHEVLFIALGAIHLPGKNGVISLMESKGYKSFRICRKERAQGGRDD